MILARGNIDWPIFIHRIHRRNRRGRSFGRLSSASSDSRGIRRIEPRAHGGEQDQRPVQGVFPMVQLFRSEEDYT